MQDKNSSISLLAEQSPAKIAKAVQNLTDDEVTALIFDWEGIWARGKQLLPDGDWSTWLILAGRGFGKTRTGAETIRIWKNHVPIIHIVAATAADARDVMVKGESGILAISPPGDRPTYEPSKRSLTWNNGCKALVFSAEEPDRLRGPQCYKAWADELAAWRYPEAWDQLKFGLRKGENPQCIVTTTPRPTKIIKSLSKSTRTHLTTGSTFENRQNVAKAWLDELVERYDGTTLGQQELHAKILDEVEGALWRRSMINYTRAAPDKMRKIVVAIDPAVSTSKTSDETGIATVGIGYDKLGYILDCESGRWTPNQWAMKARDKYYTFRSNMIVGESNNGGDLVESNVKAVDPSLPFKKVFASRGKAIRAEPIVSLYEQKKMFHVGVFSKLEDEMCTWDPAKNEFSPNNMDAMVWGASAVMLGPKGGFSWR